MLVAQSCLTLHDSMDCSQPGSSVDGLLQARILERAAIPSSRGSSRPQIKPESPAWQAYSLTSEPPGKPLKEDKVLFNGRGGGTTLKSSTRTFSVQNSVIFIFRDVHLPHLRLSSRQ